MKLQKLIAALSVLLLLLTAAIGCGNRNNVFTEEVSSGPVSPATETSDGSGALPQDYKVIKVVNFLPAGHQDNIALETVFKPMLEEMTEGRYLVEIYPDSTLSPLGGEEGFIRAIEKGTVEMGIAGVILSEQYPRLKVIDFPWVFDDVESSFKALTDPEIQEDINRDIAEAGILCKGFVLSGVRSVSNNVRPIYTLEDCNGITLRMPAVSQFIDGTQALGFDTVNLPMPQIFIALQQGVVDGQENPPTTMLQAGWYEVQKYLSLTKHQVTYNWLAVNKSFYESMTKEDQKAFDHCCDVYEQKVKELYLEREQEDLNELKSKGVQINEVDRAPFKEAGYAVVEQYCQKYPEFNDILTKLRQKGAK